LSQVKCGTRLHRIAKSREEGSTIVWLRLFHQPEHPKIWIEFRYRTPRQVVTEGSNKRSAPRIIHSFSRMIKDIIMRIKGLGRYYSDVKN